VNREWSVIGRARASACSEIAAYLRSDPLSHRHRDAVPDHSVRIIFPGYESVRYTLEWPRISLDTEAQ